METPFSDNPSILPWENHAASWDEQIGDNRNDYFSVLELPVLKRLISLQPGNCVLDLATGNGLITRWLA
jgi:2-polyprenyl-3-methyl-5-hydroxy-6-metoxy-1,4-benzoquinol methylase